MEAAGWRSTEFLLVRHGQTSWNAAGVIQGQADAPLDETGRSQAQALGAAAASGALGAIRLPVLSSDLSRAADTARALADHLRGGASTTPAAPPPIVTLHPELRERHVGVLQGVSRADAPATHRDAFRAFRSRDDAARVPGGGESFDELWDRAVGFLERVAASEPASENPPARRRALPSDGDEDASDAASADVAASKPTTRRVAVVTHGGVLRVFAARCARDAGRKRRVLTPPRGGCEEESSDDPTFFIPGSNLSGGRRCVVRNCSVGVARIYTPPRGSGEEPLWEATSWGEVGHLGALGVDALAHAFGGTEDTA